MKYSVYGNIRLGSETRGFVKTVDAASENDAKEKTFSLLGSANGVSRSRIAIQKIEKTVEAKE